MSDAEEQGHEAQRTGVPRDLPDQEAGEETEEETVGAEEGELPDTDEAGSGPRRRSSGRPGGEVEPPEPEEPTD